MFWKTLFFQICKKLKLKAQVFPVNIKKAPTQIVMMMITGKRFPKKVFQRFENFNSSLVSWLKFWSFWIKTCDIEKLRFKNREGSPSQEKFLFFSFFMLLNIFLRCLPPQLCQTLQFECVIQIPFANQFLCVWPLLHSPKEIATLWV